jgi:N utilization substance protein A
MVERYNELGVSDEIAALQGITPAIMVAVGENKIKSLDDLADLAGDELLEMLPVEISMSLAQANDIIMAARAHWFPDEDPQETEIAEGGKVAVTEAPEKELKE